MQDKILFEGKIDIPDNPKVANTLHNWCYKFQKIGGGHPEWNSQHAEHNSVSIVNGSRERHLGDFGFELFRSGFAGTITENVDSTLGEICSPGFFAPVRDKSGFRRS